jgi:xylulokinase
LTILTAQSGYSEEQPAEWVNQTVEALHQLVDVNLGTVRAVSYSGQMHGLVLLDAAGKVLRPAILWNDTRSTAQVAQIMADFGEDFVAITGNLPVEGYVLPKLMWVKEHEPTVWTKIATVMLPKDYVRYCMTGVIGTERSDATGTGLYDIHAGGWSERIATAYDIPLGWLPPITESTTVVGQVTSSFANTSGLAKRARVAAGAADNAAGAVGAGITTSTQLMASIGTSGVILKAEGRHIPASGGALQGECAAVPGTYYSMGVTLAAGHSLAWFRDTFWAGHAFDDLTAAATKSPIGAHGVIYTPYLTGERTPYFDAEVRASFSGISDLVDLSDMTRAVMEGITYSLNDVIMLYRKFGGDLQQVIAIGGGAKSAFWAQMQADIFNLPVMTLVHDEGPSLGAAIIASVAAGWFADVPAATKTLVVVADTYLPRPEAVSEYQAVYSHYQLVYPATRVL